VHVESRSAKLAPTDYVTQKQRTVITLVRFQSELFPRLDHLSLKLLYFLSKHGLGRCSRVDTAGLDGDDDVSLVLQKVVGVQTDDTSLIGLGDW
jgi:hypothetical protein